MTTDHLIASNSAPHHSRQGLLHRAFARRALLIFAALAVAACAIAPFHFAQRKFSPGNEVINVISYHDLVEHFVVMEHFDKVLRSGVIYPRWLSDMNNGYGNAWTNFYPPGFYYLASLIHSVGFDWLTTLFIASVLALAGSGIAMYALSRAFYGRLASGIAGLLYMLLPFHLLNLYWQGAMPQFTGFLFLPLVLYFAFRLGNDGRARHYAGMGLAYGLYVLTHLPVSYLMSYALALYAIIWAVSERDWRITLRIAGGMAIGLLLSAIYWLPALVESKYAFENTSGLFPYHSGYLLLLPPGDPFNYVLNHLFLVQALLLAVAIVILRSTGQRDDKTTSQKQTRLMIILGIATTFMVTSLSLYPSMLIPKIEVAAFPWRWIAVASVFTSLLAGAAAERLVRYKAIGSKTRWAGSAALIAVVIVNLWITVKFGIIPPISKPTIKSTVGLLEGNYTPRDATFITYLPDTERVMITPEGGAAEIVRWDPQYRVIAVRVDQPTELRLKSYNFPGWTARIDGEEAPLSSDKDGVQVISVPPGRHKIETRFGDTLPRKLGAGVFGLGLALIVGLALADHLTRIKTRSHEPVIGDETTEGQTSPRVARQKTRLIAAGFVVLAVIVVGVAVKQLSKPSSEDGLTAGEAPTESASRAIAPNSEVRLFVGAMNPIPVAVDERALDELMSALAMRNNERVEELIQARKLFRVEKNTRVRILEAGSGKLKVRILEGDSVTLDGWVPERWIR